MNNLKTVRSIALISLCLASPLIFAKSGTVSNSMQEAVATVEQAASDTAITAKIKGIYASEKVFGDQDISVLGVKVETIHGVVRLTGNVTSEDQANNAIKLARSVKGVNKVIFNLKVKSV